jgi:hypothetical protein
VAYKWSVMVDGTDVAALVPDGSAVINYGRQDVTDPFQPTMATIELITRDAPDYTTAMGAALVEFHLGDHSQVSGFTDTYAATYDGALSRITLGANVDITTGLPTGFTDTYEAGYTSGDDKVRFAGEVVAIDYSPDRIMLTAAHPMEALARMNVYTDGLPVESDVDRMDRFLPGTLHHNVGDYVTLVATEAVDPATGQRPQTNVLAAMSQVADEAYGVLYGTRNGEVAYLNGTYGGGKTVELPADATFSEPLQMTAEIGEVVNSVFVVYGPDTARVTEHFQDAASIAVYGEREIHLDTALNDAASAAKVATDILTRCARPIWKMSGAEVNLSLLNDAGQYQVSSVDIGDTVRLPKLLPGSPTPAYQAQCLGYTEIISHLAWTVTFYLADSATALAGR